MTDKQKKRKQKAITIQRENRRKIFAYQYVKHNGDVAIAAKKAGWGKNSDNAARVTGSQLLKEDGVKRDIAHFLEAQGLNLADVVATHKRNMLQDDHLPTSQKAVKDYYELTGMTQQKADTSVNVAFIIEE